MRGLFDDHEPPLVAGPTYSPRDPSTSAAAAAAHERSGARRINAAIVLELVRRYPGLTAVELWERQETTCLSRHEVSRRLPDLKNAGRVRQGAQRRCSVYGTMMKTWWLVEE